LWNLVEEWVLLSALVVEGRETKLLFQKAKVEADRRRL